MGRGSYSQGKRRRESEKARKKKEKAERRMRKRERGPGEVPIVSIEDVVGTLPSIDSAMKAIETRAEGGTAAAAIPCRLFVGGLSWGTTETDLRATFAKFGPVAHAVIITDRDTGDSRGFGFVTMEDRKDASRAIKALHDSELNGRTIVVNAATERQR